MAEYYKKVVCVQFMPTDTEKELVLKGIPVSWEAQTIKHGANGRFHVLIPIGERPVPIYETQWLIRNPELEILNDYDFKRKFILVDDLDPADVKKKLDAFMADKQNNQ